jgi:hypothetical protein
MGLHRGYGQPGKWLPWVDTNHIYSIVGLQDYDKGLFEKLANLPAQAMK